MPFRISGDGLRQFNGTEGGFEGNGDPSNVVVSSRAAPNPTNGPSGIFVYSNDSGVFKLAPYGGQGSADYFWGGSRHHDILEFVGFISVLDRSGIGVQQNSQVDIWLYKASDLGGNSWFLGFGFEPLNLRRGIFFPLYYSYIDPQIGGNVKRWLTQSGTKRI